MSEALQLESIWQNMSGILKGRVTEDVYDRWIASLSLVSVTESDMVIEVADEIALAWIESYYKEMIQETALLIMQQPRQVIFRLPEGMRQDEVEEKAVLPADSGKREPAPRKSQGPTNPKYRFDNFVVGPNSQFAHAAALAVAKNPSQSYNPLFIHGGSGLGKTHLMQAIGNAMAASHGEQSVVYLTCEQFTNEFIDAIQNNSLAKFRRKYRKAELLLLDDVQFFGGKERSQEEFFHTFNSLFDGRKQIVLTSDRPACEISKLEPRLVSRFECGLTVEIQPPSLETRVAILQQKREDWGVSVADEVLHFLADRIRKNVRRLEGALMRVATYASLTGQSPAIERIEFMLRDILREESRKVVTIDSIQRRVAEHFEIRLADMTSRRRPANIAFPRQIAMYLSRRLTGASLVEIGEAFGGRDHGTVIHANKTIESRMEKDHKLRDVIEHLDEALR